MTMTVQALQNSPGELLFYDEDWMTLIETHLPCLRLDANSSVLNVDPHLVNMFRGDFYGLLMNLSTPIPPKYHYVILRANGFTNPLDYPLDITTLLIPADQIIEQLRKIYQTVSSKTN